MKKLIFVVSLVFGFGLVVNVNVVDSSVIFNGKVVN